MGPVGRKETREEGATARANLPCLPCKGRAGVPEETMNDPGNPNTNLITRPSMGVPWVPCVPRGRWVVVARPELVFAVRERSSVVEFLACPKTLSTITLGPSFGHQSRGGAAPLDSRSHACCLPACLLACSPAQSSQTIPYDTHFQLPCLVPCALQDGDISDCKSGRRGLHITRGLGTVRKTDRC